MNQIAYPTDIESEFSNHSKYTILDNYIGRISIKFFSLYIIYCMHVYSTMIIEYTAKSKNNPNVFYGCYYYDWKSF